MRELGRNHGSIRGRLQAERRTLEQHSSDAQRLVSQFADCEARILESSQKAETFQAELVELEQESHGEEQNILMGLTEKASELEQVRRAGRRQLETLAHDVQNARKKLDSIRSEAARQELESRKIQLEKESVLERFQTEFGTEELEKTCSRSIR